LIPDWAYFHCPGATQASSLFWGRAGGTSGHNSISALGVHCFGAVFFWFKPEQHKKWVFFVLECAKCEKVGWCQDNGNRSNQDSKFDFLAIRQCLVKIDKGQQKIKIVSSNQQSNLRSSCQSIFSLSWHHPSEKVGFLCWSIG